MAQLALLLKLRLLLWARQWRLSCALQILVFFGALILLFVVAHATAALVKMHGQLGDDESLRLGQLFSLAITLALTVAPLTGFRAQEFMDVTQLFTLPLRPLTIFSSTVLGGFFGAITLAALPLLILPPAMRRPDRTLEIVATTLAFLAVLHTCLQCVTLGFLNVLRSRRFRDIAAVLAPGIGLLIYGSLQGLVFVQLEPGMLPSLAEFLNADALQALDRARPFLPPLWYAEAAYGDAPAWPTILALVAIAGALTWLGTRATVHAYYGVVAHAPTKKVARRARGRWIESMLGTDVAALYAKERSVFRRDPWTRILLVQQLAFLALIALGEDWLLRNSQFPRGFPIVLLLFLEAGFLQNQLGIEGSSFVCTASLPARGSRILLAKNLVWLRGFAIANTILVPALSALSAWITERPLQTPTLVAHLTVALVILPAVFGPANLISVLLPLRVPQRSRRSLGQGISQGGGCSTMLLRSFSTLLALVPGLVFAWWILQPKTAGELLDPGWIFVRVLPASAMSVLVYAICTKRAGAALDSRRSELAQFLR